MVKVNPKSSLLYDSGSDEENTARISDGATQMCHVGAKKTLKRGLSLHAFITTRIYHRSVCMHRLCAKTCLSLFKTQKWSSW